MNTECTGDEESVCITDGVKEKEFHCCSSLEQEDSSFQDCKGWCSIKAIDEDDEDGEIE